MEPEGCERSHLELLAFRREVAELAKLEAEATKVVEEMRRLRISNLHDAVRTTLLVVGAFCAVLSTTFGWIQLQGR